MRARRAKTKAKARKAGARKTRPRKAVKRAPRPKTKRAVAPRDVEELFVESLASHSAPDYYHSVIENLIYSTNPALSRIGYGYGFSIGKTLALKSNGKEALLNSLKKLGMGDVLYHPHFDSTAITAHSNQRPVDAGRNVHVIESGIISGYLSAETSLSISTKEVHCIYNGSDHCQFLSSATEPSWADHSTNPNATAQQIAEVASEGLSMHSSGSHPYQIMVATPLISEPLATEVSKLLYLSGKMMSGMVSDDKTAATINELCSYFGIRLLQFSESKKVIKLRYNHYNSSDGFVRISSSMVSGFVAGRYGSGIEIGKRLQNNTYTVEIKMK